MAMLWHREQALALPHPTVTARHGSTDPTPEANPPSPRGYYSRTQLPRKKQRKLLAADTPTASGPSWRQMRAPPRPYQGHSLRGRGGLEFCVKTEFQMNQSIQTMFHVYDAEGKPGWLQLDFHRRSPLKGWDPQRFSYLVEITWPKFKQLMKQPTMSSMAFYVTKFDPNPLLQSTVLSRAAANAGSRSDVSELRRLEGELKRKAKYQDRKARYDSWRLFESSTSGMGHTLAMSALGLSLSRGANG